MRATGRLKYPSFASGLHWVLHNFRRTFATLHHESGGVSIRTLAAWLGHAEVATTWKYIAVVDKRSPATRRAVNNRFAGLAPRRTGIHSPARRRPPAGSHRMKAQRRTESYLFVLPQGATPVDGSFASHITKRSWSIRVKGRSPLGAVFFEKTNRPTLAVLFLLSSSISRRAFARQTFLLLFALNNIRPPAAKRRRSLPRS
jgi:hypothetical protein